MFRNYSGRIVAEAFRICRAVRFFWPEDTTALQIGRLWPDAQSFKKRDCYTYQLWSGDMCNGKYYKYCTHTILVGYYVHSACNKKRSPI